MNSNRLKNIANLSRISLAILCPLCSYNAIAESNHNNESGDQTVVMNGVDIQNDYYSLYTDGNIDMTFTDAVIDAGTYTQALIADTDQGSVNFNADNLTTQGGGEVELIGGGDVTATISNSHFGSMDYNDADSLWLDSYYGDVSASVENSVFTGRLDITAAGDINAIVSDSEVDQTINAKSNGANSKATVSIENSTVTTDNASNTHSAAVHVEGGSAGATAYIDDSTIGLATNSSPAISQDVEVFTHDGGQASAIVSGSSIEDGIYTYAEDGGDSLIQVNDSQVGTEQTADDVSYMLVAQSARNTVGEGSAALYLNDSQIDGNISAQSQGDSDAQITLTNGSTVNGNVRLVGSDMVMNINGSTLNGNIEASSYSESDIGSEGTNMTLNLSNTAYRGNIDSNDDDINEALTVNINNGAVIGGESIDSAMQITGYDTVNFNVNYLDSSLINTGKVSYFYLDDGEQVSVDSSVANGTLSPIRSGSYIMDNVVYQATDVSDQTAKADDGNTWGVSFYSNGPTPSDEDVAADIQSAQAGLMASDDMIHRIADGITHQMDSAKTDERSHLWMQGIYASGDRTAGVTQYSNDITGMQIGGDVSHRITDDSVVGAGLALGYLNNDLSLNGPLDGHNNIDGAYYSVYANWKQLLSDNKNWGWFADTVFTYGDMSYSTDGHDGGIAAGSDYDGRSWLVQGRVGAQINATRQFWLRPYVTLGYDNIHTDGFNDGYSDISSGKQDGGFTGAGIQAGTNYQLHNVELKPYVELAYLAQFSTDTQFHTDDYDFSGQNLNGGNTGVGLEAKFSNKWSADTRVNTEFGHDVDNEVNAYINVKYQF